MFVDASAIVAMLLREPNFELLVKLLDKHAERLTSAIAIWEATARIERNHAPLEARAQVLGLLDDANISVSAIGPEEARIASEARVRSNKGRYKLNMGDCFAYACAKSNGVPLLFVGIDFTKTDVNDGFDL
jgi:ribonuclease VapC